MFYPYISFLPPPPPSKIKTFSAAVVFFPLHIFLFPCYGFFAYTAVFIRDTTHREYNPPLHIFTIMESSSFPIHITPRNIIFLHMEIVDIISYSSKLFDTPTVGQMTLCQTT